MAVFFRKLFIDASDPRFDGALSDAIVTYRCRDTTFTNKSDDGKTSYCVCEERTHMLRFDFWFGVMQFRWKQKGSWKLKDT